MKQQTVLLIAILALVLLWLLTKMRERVTSTITFPGGAVTYSPAYGTIPSGLDETLNYYGEM